MARVTLGVLVEKDDGEAEVLIPDRDADVGALAKAHGTNRIVKLSRPVVPTPRFVGVVYYLDDPKQEPFRWVYPNISDDELDDPCHTTVGVDPKRFAVLRKVLASSMEASSPMGNLASAALEGEPLPANRPSFGRYTG